MADLIGAIGAFVLGSELALYGIKYLTIRRIKIGYSKLDKHAAKHVEILTDAAYLPTPADILKLAHDLDNCKDCLERRVAA